MPVDMPPWDVNEAPKNPIDARMVFKKPRGLLDDDPIMKPSLVMKVKDSINLDPSMLDLNQEAPKQASTQSSPTPKAQHAPTPPAPPSDTGTTSEASQNAPAAPKASQSQGLATQSQVLAIRYRPKLFCELVGQESVSSTLSLALDTGRVAHAYLFSGLRGSGKTSSARIFARCLQCENGPTSKPCGVCANCLSALDGNNPDIVELDGASNRRTDDARELIQQTKYRPSLGRFRIFIIDEVHMLTREAFNALLKTLEEPPGYVKFILATTDPLKVPPTILSRTQHFRFKKIAAGQIKTHLSNILSKEGVSCDEASLDLLVRNGQGSLRDTLTLLDQAIIFCQGTIQSSRLAQMLGAIDLKIFDSLFAALASKSKQACLDFLTSIESYEVEMVLDSLSLYLKDKLRSSEVDSVLGLRYARIIADSKSLLRLDCDGDLCLLLTVLKMLEAQKLEDIEDAIRRLESNPAALDTKTNQAQRPSQAMESKISSQTQNAAPHSQTPPTSSATTNIQATQAPYTNQAMDSKAPMQSNATPPGIAMQNLAPQNPDQMHAKNLERYKNMVSEIARRDLRTGEIFEQSIVFEGVDEAKLYLTSYANEEQSLVLRQGYKGILEIARSFFGSAIGIDVKKKPLASPPKAKPINLRQDNIQDFIKNNSALLGTIKSQLGVKSMQIVDYK